MEARVTPLAIALLCALAAGLGSVGTLGIQHALTPDAPTIADTAPTVEAVATTVSAAVEPETIEARTRLAIAEAPAVNLAVAAAVEPGASPCVLALSGYLGCLAAAQAQAQGAAAFGCAERGKALDACIAALLEDR